MSDGNRILVTGGGGFIGSHLVDRLSLQNEVHVLDDFSTGYRENIRDHPSANIIEGDIRDSSTVASAVRGCDIVIHLAAMVGVRRTLEYPVDVLDVNIEGTRTVLKEAAEAGVDRVVTASTSEVYGSGPEPPYTEDESKTPESDYAVSKLSAERYTTAYAEKYGVEYTLLRYFNVYGPRQDNSEYGYVVPIFVQRALEGESLEVHGSGAQTRDFTYIRDAVEGTIKALGDAGRNEVFNIGTGRETSIRELAEIVTEVVADSKIRTVEHPRPYVIDRRCADIVKANELLSFQAEHSLEEGLRETVYAMKES